MNRLEAWLLHLSTIVLTVTGAVYACMHYLMKPVDPFSVINHPLEPYMLDIHIIAAPVLVVAIGIILHSHILFKIEGGSRAARKSGIILIPLFLVMAASGYVLQITSGSINRIFFWLHLSSGSLWALVYAAHHLASISVRRTMAAARANLAQNGKPVHNSYSTTNIVRKNDSDISITPKQ
ncbi:hypothetical protein L0244_20745 [bacterium]|nr:hypothetical protein [bacterium]MCI0615425.1 hypothetical protein [bacterium]